MRGQQKSCVLPPQGTTRKLQLVWSGPVTNRDELKEIKDVCGSPFENQNCQDIWTEGCQFSFSTAKVTTRDNENDGGGIVTI